MDRRFGFFYTELFSLNFGLLIPLEMRLRILHFFEEEVEEHGSLVSLLM